MNVNFYYFLPYQNDSPKQHKHPALEIMIERESDKKFAERLIDTYFLLLNVCTN